MIALSLVLFRNNSEFGMYKIAMYLQPFLLGVMSLTWYEMFDRAADRVLFACCWWQGSY